jgi:predicted transcriptional regulator
MPKRSDDPLSRREREIMNAVFALRNRAFAEDIRDRLTNPPTHSAVRVMLARLEKKGCLKHVQEGARRSRRHASRGVAARPFGIFF